MEKLLKALDFANYAHRKQVRKSSKLPYIVHPFAVAMILKDQGCPEEVIIAGLLHDTIEDTSATYEDIHELFGKKVADLVLAVTEPDKSKSWQERKQHTIDKLFDAPLEVKLIKAADKYHNLFSILQEVELKGSRVWDAFSQGKESQKWYAKQVYQSILANIRQPQQYPLFHKLKTLIDTLFEEG